MCSPSHDAHTSRTLCTLFVVQISGLRETLALVPHPRVLETAAHLQTSEVIIQQNHFPMSMRSDCSDLMPSNIVERIIKTQRQILGFKLKIREAKRPTASSYLCLRMKQAIPPPRIIRLQCSPFGEMQVSPNCRLILH